MTGARPTRLLFFLIVGLVFECLTAKNQIATTRWAESTCTAELKGAELGIADNICTPGIYSECGYDPKSQSYLLVSCEEAPNVTGRTVEFPTYILPYMKNRYFQIDIMFEGNSANESDCNANGTAIAASVQLFQYQSCEGIVDQCSHNDWTTCRYFGDADHGTTPVIKSQPTDDSLLIIIIVIVILLALGGAGGTTAKLLQDQKKKQAESEEAVNLLNNTDDHDTTINIEHKYDDRKIIALNSSSVVHEEQEGDETIAAKSRINAGNAGNVAFEEYYILRKLRHPNIIRVVGLEEGTSTSKLKMEKCDYSLADRLCKPTNSIEENSRVVPLSEMEIISYVLQLGAALTYLRTKDESKSIIVHGDIAPRNILFMNRNGANNNINTNNILAVPADLKLGDFDFATERNDANPFQHRRKEVRKEVWVAPEVSKQNLYSPKSDAFSFGVICGQMLLGESLQEVPLILNRLAEIYGKFHEESKLNPAIKPGPRIIIIQIAIRCMKEKLEERYDISNSIIVNSLRALESYDLDILHRQ